MRVQKSRVQESGTGEDVGELFLAPEPDAPDDLDLFQENALASEPDALGVIVQKVLEGSQESLVRSVVNVQVLKVEVAKLYVLAL